MYSYLGNAIPTVVLVRSTDRNEPELGPLLFAWINLHPSMDKEPYALWNYSSFPNLDFKGASVEFGELVFSIPH